MRALIFLLLFFIFFSISNAQSKLIVLGTVQDAGSPHIACMKECCEDLFKDPDPDRRVVSLGLIDVETQKQYLFEATPDLSAQTKELSSGYYKELPDGIFLTHAHIGHYTGLMYLGKEATDASSVPVYAMPRMKCFLESNGPWDQLVSRKNIQLIALAKDKPLELSTKLKVSPFLVPHRDEYSETVGYKIVGESKSAVFIPDIDKWEKWEASIIELIKEVDYAFLDATFFSGEEIGYRDIRQIPHPFVIESMELLDSLNDEDRSKVIFIHFNHTNPLLNPDSEESKRVEEKGYKIARKGDVFEL